MRAEMSVPAPPAHNSTSQSSEEAGSGGTWVPVLNSIRANSRSHPRADEQQLENHITSHHITSQLDPGIFVLSKPTPPRCNLKLRLEGLPLQPDRTDDIRQSFEQPAASRCPSTSAQQSTLLILAWRKSDLLISPYEDIAKCFVSPI